MSPRNTASLTCAFWLLSIYAATVAQRAGAQNTIQLDDVTASTGIDFVHTDGSDGKYFLIESMSAGLAVADFDNDGRPDIYFLNGARIAAVGQGSEPETPTEPLPSNALYKNHGGLRFQNRTSQAGLADTRMGLGVVTGDFDNDGFLDVYVNNYGPNVLFHNNGDGTFSNLTRFANVGNGNLVGGGVSFFDMDADGDLDLYVGNYIQFDPAQHKVHMHKGRPAYPSPLSFTPEFDTLFENLGDGTFVDASEPSGVRQFAGRTMGLVTFDYDADGDIDVFTANDTQENFLLENDGLGHFEEVALLAGVACDFKGKPQASMGVSLSDMDRDGKADLFLTSFSEEFATLYRNDGDGLFDDVTLQIGGSEATFPHVTWGIASADFDNDGQMDYLVGTGDLDPERELRGGVSSTTAFKVPNVLLAGNAGTLSDLKQNWGTAALVAESTRGLVTVDLDSDGKLDAIALNARSRPTVMHNRSSPQDFLSIRLVGTTSNRDATGAVVRVEYQGLHQSGTISSGTSYQSDSPRDLHFGLGTATQASAAAMNEPARISIRWPNGQETTSLAKLNRRTLIVQPAKAPQPR